MSRVLWLRNRQRSAKINLRLFRRIALFLLTHECPKGYELGVHLVDAAEMTDLNEHFLRHAGSTDVITFNYAESGVLLYGEIFICLPEARIQARRFRTSWQAELVRYLVHGFLHLQGHDDLKPAARRKMKREENRRLRELAERFHFKGLGCAR